MMQLVVGALIIGLQAAAVWAAIRAIRSARTPQGAVGWVVFLLAAPYVALPVFLFLGHSRLPGYVVARRSYKPEISAMLAREQARRAAPAPEVDEQRPQWRGFERLAGMPVVSGNGVRLLMDGHETYGEILSAIAKARSYVMVQSYIFRDDRLGRALQLALIERARGGCKVRLLYDGIGSYALSDSYLDELVAAGGEVANFHSIRKARNRFQVNFRNHRKITIVDGQTGYVGGHNVGDEYMGRDPDIGHWRDTHLEVRGPMVAQLQLNFAEDWFWATEETLQLDWQPVPDERDLRGVILAPGPADRLETGSLYFCNAIGLARERIWIASPYFVPDTDILSALSLAALRGVDVRILMAGESDSVLVRLAAHAYYDAMLDAGVTIMRYVDGFMHQKVLVVDESLASVGTMNLDYRSCRLNFEVTAIVFDAGFARATAAMLEEDFEQSDVVRTRLADDPSFLVRHGAPLARLFAPLL